MRIVVSGTLTVDGAVRANGGGAGAGGGGGSGGAIWITAGGVAGAGSIQANGSNGAAGAVVARYGGGGGGGRVAIDGFAGGVVPTLQTYGGAPPAGGGQQGGAGTIFTRALGAPDGTLKIVNSGTSGAVTDFVDGTYVFANVLVDGSAIANQSSGDIFTIGTLTINTGTWAHPAGASEGVTLTVTTMTVAAAGIVEASARGDAGGNSGGADGAGAGGGGGSTSTVQGGGGGGHGGRGGYAGTGNQPGGLSHDSLGGPTTAGSGGGGSSYDGGAGGRGGGRIRLIVSGVLTVDGIVRANGGAAAAGGGGGAGGAIWITAAGVAGTGSILANGGTGGTGAVVTRYGGGGGGGRISVDGYTGSMPLTAQAYGGAPPVGGGQRGGAGTIFTHATTAPNGDLVVHNGGTAGGVTELGAGPYALENMTVEGGAVFSQTAGVMVTIGTLTINTGTWTHPVGASEQVAIAATTMTVSAAGLIDVNTRGSAGGSGGGAGAGPGAGFGSNSTVQGGGGAGHGGAGGDGGSGAAAGGPTFGSLSAPVDFGSGGGAASYDAGSAGRGGGRIRLVVSGVLTVDGTIRANGGSAGAGGGGGSGGSIWIAAANVAGTGAIQAIGGNGIAGGVASRNGGGAGGGRLAIFTDSGTIAPTLNVAGGTASGATQPGAAGVVMAPLGSDALISLSSPANGFVGSFAGGVTFNWAGFTLPGGGSFRVELDDDLRFAEGQAGQPASYAEAGEAVTIVTGLTGNSHFIASVTAGKTWYWHVYAVDSGGATVAGSPAFRFTPTTANPPDAPAALGQFKLDGATAIAVGDLTNESTVILRGTLTDPDAGDTIKMQVEVLPVGIAFTNTPMIESAFVANGATANVPVPSLGDGTSYHWQARSVDIGGTASAWTVFGGNADPFDPDFAVDMTAPTVDLTAPDGGQIFAGGAVTAITWVATDASGVPSIDLDYSTDGGATFPFSIAAGQPNTGVYAWNVPSIDSATVRVRVTAHDAVGSTASDSSSLDFMVDSTPPSAPGMPSASATPNTGSFSVTWTAATDGGAGVTSYTLERSFNAGAYGTAASGLTSTSYTETSLPSGTYTYRVQAIDGVGQAGAMSAVSASVVVDAIAPSAVADLLVLAGLPSPPTVSTLTLTWTSPGDDGAAGTATSYDLRYLVGVPINAGNFASATPVAIQPVPTVGGSAAQTTVTGLNPGTTYYFALTATDDVGIVSLLSNSSGGSTRVAAPQNLVASPGGGNIACSWDAVIGAVGYFVHYGTASGVYGGVGAAEGPSPIEIIGATSVVLHVPNGTTLYVAVAAYGPTSSDTGDLSSEVSATATSTASLTAPDGGEIFAGGASTTITWTATDPNGVAAISLDYSTDGGATFPFSIVVGEANTGVYAWTVPSIDSATVRVRVTAFDPSGNPTSDSSAANFRIDSTPPSAPGAPSASASPNAGSFTVNWTAATDSGSGVASYALERSLNAAAYVTVASGLTLMSYSESGLASGSYTYRVTATDTAGNAGTASAVSSSVIVDADAPSAVADLLILTGAPSPPTETTLTLTWTSPGDDGASGTAASYDLRYLAGGTINAGNFGSATQVAGGPAPTVAGSAVQVTVIGLTSGTTYSFALTATDDVGNVSLLSNVAGGFTRVGAPQNLAASPGDGLISYSWDAVTGAVGYLVHYGTASGTYDGTGATEGPSPIDVTGATSLVLHVANGTTLYVAVEAYAPTSSDTGNISSEVSGTAAATTYESVRAISGGTSATAYRMIGFPVTPSNPDAMANLSDDLGPADSSSWRAFAWSASGQVYQEITAVGSHSIQPGTAFWFISRNGATLDVTGTAASTGAAYSLTLQPGWNLISNPFTFTVNWFDCTVGGLPIPSQSSVGVELWDYSGSYQASSQLASGRGYFVRNLTASAVTLWIPPVAGAKPTWIDPAALGVLYASSGPPPPTPGELVSASGSATTTGASAPAASPTASGVADVSGSPAASGGGGSGGGSGGGCVIASLPAAGPRRAALVIGLLGLLLAMAWLVSFRRGR